MKLLLRGYDDKGALVSEMTREFEVTKPGDGVYNVSTEDTDGERRALTVSVSVVV